MLEKLSEFGPNLFSTTNQHYTKYYREPSGTAALLAIIKTKYKAGDRDRERWGVTRQKKYNTHNIPQPPGVVCVSVRERLRESGS